MRLALEQEGWTVSGEAENGRVALARLAETRPDVIVLDLMMPEMDGFEFLVEMRSRAEWRDIPVLVVTAKDLTEEERARLNGDVERVLQKGASDVDELLRELGRILPGSIERGRSDQMTEVAGMKILYVEDNDDNIYMLQRRLARAGFTVVIARDGAQGVAMAAAEQPRPDPDGPGPAGARRLGGDAPAQGRAGDQAHSGDRADRATR